MWGAVAWSTWSAVSCSRVPRAASRKMRFGEAVVRPETSVITEVSWPPARCVESVNSPQAVGCTHAERVLCRRPTGSSRRLSVCDQRIVHPQSVDALTRTVAGRAAGRCASRRQWPSCCLPSHWPLVRVLISGFDSYLHGLLMYLPVMEHWLFLSSFFSPTVAIKYQLSRRRAQKVDGLHFKAQMPPSILIIAPNSVISILR